MTVPWSIKAIISTLLLVVVIVGFFPRVFAPTQSRYFRGDQHTVNGLSAYQLGTSQSAIAQNAYQYYTISMFYWGIRVWFRDSGGSETEITDGTPVAQVIRTSVGSGIQFATWACPETDLDVTDAVVIRVYIQAGGIWYEKAEFITEQLGADTLESSTWYVYYYTALVEFGVGYRGVFYWGTASYNSYVYRFKWTAPTKTWNTVASWTFTLNTREWLSLIDWNFTLITRQWQNIATWTFSLLTRQWNTIASWSFQLLTMGWKTVAQWLFSLTSGNVAVLFVGLLILVGLIVVPLLVLRKKR